MNKVLVFGGEGLIGSRFIELNKKRFDIQTPLACEVDFLKDDQLEKAVKSSDASIIINFVAYTNVDEAEKEKDNKDGVVYKLNVGSTERLTQACKETGKYLIHISTDYVFDGKQEDRPYTEEDIPNPLSWYAQTKYLAEQVVTERGDKFAIVRFELPFRSHYEIKKDIARFFVEQLQQNKQITAITDQKITPLFIDDGAMALGEIAENQSQGVYHVVCSDSTTTFDFVKLIAEKFGLDQNLIKPTAYDEYSKTRTAQRPHYSWMDTTKFRKQFGEGILHTISESLDIFKQQIDEKSSN